MNYENNKYTAIYISGAISGKPQFRETFAAAEKQLREEGYQNIFNPAEQDFVIGVNPDDCTLMNGKPGSKRAMVLTRDIKWIGDNSATLMVLDGYGSSTGSLAEIYFARALGLPIFRFPDRTKVVF